jgi:hypothetical protein
VPRGPSGGGGSGGVEGAAERCTRGKLAVAADGESPRSRVLARLAPGDGLSGGLSGGSSGGSSGTSPITPRTASLGLPSLGRQLLSRRSRARLGGGQGGQGALRDVGRAVSRAQEAMSLSVIVPVTNSGAPRWSVWAMQAGNASGHCKLARRGDDD